MRELLLCAPDYYGIEYEINPWMSRSRAAEIPLAQAQWRGLHAKLLELRCHIHLVPGQPRLPDMVFTANAGLTVGRRFIPSNFRHEERAREATFFAQWMETHEYEVVWLPPSLYFEGEGDALFGGDALFCGYKFRSDIQSHRAVADILACLVISVELVDPRFYHLDTCFCPLPDGGAFWFPQAFDEYGQRAIREHVTDLIDVVEEEAAHFSCNAVVLERDIVLPEGAPNLVQTLHDRGYRCHPLPMSEFLKAGGACKCLTMFMPQRQTAGTPDGAIE
ncbi:MAG: dimethylarginine dimethylaminohydrolase family protein [Chthoniobacterales bacterium]